MRRLLAMLTAITLVLAACATQPAEERTTTTEAPTNDPETTSSDGGSDETPGTREVFTYAAAIFEDITTDNFWAYLDPELTVWNGYVIGAQAPSMFGYASPTNQLVPVLAEGLPAEPRQDGEVWSVTQPIRQGLIWSHGEPITADDVVFTFETVRDLGLGGSWPLFYPVGRDDDPATEEDEFARGLLAVEAVDDHTVRYTFNTRPGLAIWQFGVGLGPVMAEHFWGETVAAATSAEDLYGASGEGAPSMDAFDISEREPGAFVRRTANPNYPFRGATTRLYDDGTYELEAPSLGISERFYGDASGELTHEYTDGPYADEIDYSVYSSQDAAVLALTNGDVDIMLSSLGLQRGLQQLVLAEPDLDVIVNPSNSYRYLAFNMRRWPMSDLAFRQAVACMIDKEFMASSVLQGSAIPVWGQIPEGNAFWHNPDTPRWCEGLTHEERLNTAIEVLEEAGYTWETRPQWDPDNLDALPAGEGLTGPDGTPVPELTLLAPGPGYDPLRATYSLFIEDWANDLGIPVRAEPTGFNVIVDEIVDPSAPFDMYILGWTLTPFPDHITAFFRSSQDSTQGGLNYPGYSNPEFDALANAFDETTDVEEARELVAEMDRILAEDLPYAVLFTAPIIEPYRTNLTFPFTGTLDGIQSLSGLPSYVQLAS